MNSLELQDSKANQSHHHQESQILICEIERIMFCQNEPSHVNAELHNGKNYEHVKFTKFIQAPATYEILQPNRGRKRQSQP